MAKPAMSPQAPGVQLQDQVLVARTEGVQFFRRGERVLVIEPQTASWTVMDPASWAVYVRLDPKPLANLPTFPISSPDCVFRSRATHRLGMVGLNGLHDLIVCGRITSPGPRFLALHVTRQNFACAYCYNCSGVLKP